MKWKHEANFLISIFLLTHLDEVSKNHLEKGPNEVDERTTEKNVDDDNHDEAENIKCKTAELVILVSKIIRYLTNFIFLPAEVHQTPE